MRVLLDANILLDVALDRKPFVEESSRLVKWCQAAPQSAIIAWHTVSNVYYLLRAARDDGKAREFISNFLGFAAVAGGGTETVRHALMLPMVDFEDALQVVAAISADAQFIITRDLADFRRSPVAALTPIAFLDRVVK